MSHDLTPALLGAVLSATVGGIFVRTFLAGKYDALVLLWLLIFCASFVSIFSIVEDINTWLILVMMFASAASVAFLKFGLASDASARRGWRIGGGMALLGVSVFIRFSFRWWVEGGNQVFGNYSWLVNFVGMLIVGLVGVIMVVSKRE